MSKKANPTLIGGFVVGAIVLVMAGVILFGSGKFLKDTTTFVLYFDGDVAGLSIGSPVTFRGVKIGSVTKILINYDHRDMSMRIPVFIEVDTDKVQSVNGKPIKTRRQDIILDLVNRGLRAKLKVQSLVTGQLYVELDFHPEKPARLVGAEVAGHDAELPELPTIPSDIEELQRTLKKIPVETMISQALAALEGIERVVNSAETNEAIRAFGQSMKNIEKVAETLNERFPALASNIGDTMTDTRRLVQHADRMVGNIDGEVDGIASNLEKTVAELQKLTVNLNSQLTPLTSDFEKTSQAARKALVQAEDTLSALEKIPTKESPLGYKLYTTLDELSDAARSVRIMAEYLERHPEALIQGKGGN